MNAGPDVERRISDWLAEEVPTRAPDRILPATFERSRQTRQRRPGAAWRTSLVTGSVWRLAAAAIVGLLIIGLGVVFVGHEPGSVGGQRIPTPTPTPTELAAPAPTATTASASVTARLEPFGHVGPPPASITVTVPTNWIADETTSVGKAGVDVEPALYAWQVSSRFSHPCTDHTLLVPAPGPGVDALLEALANQPGITAGPITDVTVDGRRGKYVELTVATDIVTCPDLASRFDDVSGFWLWASPDGSPRFVQGNAETNRIYALDVDGTRFTFTARIPSGTTAEDLAALQAIIDSIQVEPGPASSPSN